MALSKTLQQQLVARIVHHAVHEEEEEIKRLRTKFADAVYSELYSAEEFELINKVPKKFIKHYDYFRVRLGSQIADLRMSASRPLESFSYGDILKSFDHHDASTKAFEALKEREKEAKDKRSKLEGQAAYVIGSVSTLKKLWQVWPDAHSVLKEFDAVPTGCSVIIVPETLNKDFKLPK
jgi:hypothetical protein